MQVVSSRGRCREGVPLAGLLLGISTHDNREKKQNWAGGKVTSEAGLAKPEQRAQPEALEPSRVVWIQDEMGGPQSVVGCASLRESHLCREGKLEKLKLEAWG